MNDFKNENLYVVSFKNRHTLCHLIGMISKIMRGKYYTDGCSATVIMLNNVATPQNPKIAQFKPTPVLLLESA